MATSLKAVSIGHNGRVERFRTRIAEFARGIRVWNALERFVRACESARDRTNWSSAKRNSAVRPRAARANAEAQLPPWSVAEQRSTAAPRYTACGWAAAYQRL